jgi:NADPH:quinone reductase
MAEHIPSSNLTMLTRVKSEGELDVYLTRLPMSQPEQNQVLIKMLAAPINPSDMVLLFGAADMSTARSSICDGLPKLTASIPASGMRAMTGRINEALPIGNEGCGLVVGAGISPEAQALLGKMVAVIGGPAFAEYLCLGFEDCMALPDATDPRDGASSFVNPLTALAFVETMRIEGHCAIVHTAAASNLGQMLIRICANDGIPLVNIVRNQTQVELLRRVGATYVVDSSDPNFSASLDSVVLETGASIAFDAIGGGTMAAQILGSMERAASTRMTTYSRYGSDATKQVYIYGALDLSPTILNRSFGLTWGLGGFLLPSFLLSSLPSVIEKMHNRVAAELTTTFKSNYSHEISLAQALDPDVVTSYNAKQTGEKYLIRPFAS